MGDIIDFNRQADMSSSDQTKEEGLAQKHGSSSGDGEDFGSSDGKGAKQSQGDAVRLFLLKKIGGRKCGSIVSSSPFIDFLNFVF